MMLTITDRDLAVFAALPVSEDLDTLRISWTVFQRMVAELRERRAADLSDDEREALKWLRVRAVNADPISKEGRDARLTAIDTLDKLLGGSR